MTFPYHFFVISKFLWCRRWMRHTCLWAADPTASSTTSAAWSATTGCTTTPSSKTTRPAYGACLTTPPLARLATAQQGSVVVGSCRRAEDNTCHPPTSRTLANKSPPPLFPNTIPTPGTPPPSHLSEAFTWQESCEEVCKYAEELSFESLWFGIVTAQQPVLSREMMVMVMQVGDWRAVQQKCHLGKIQPSVLFYTASWIMKGGKAKQ